MIILRVYSPLQGAVETQVSLCEGQSPSGEGQGPASGGGHVEAGSAALLQAWWAASMA